VDAATHPIANLDIFRSIRVRLFIHF
jgi:hypothetical protein